MIVAEVTACAGTAGRIVEQVVERTAGIAATNKKYKILLVRLLKYTRICKDSISCKIYRYTLKKICLALA